MASLSYWDGARWAPITSAGTGAGPQGPAGADGQSVSVFVQGTQPVAKREGDVWIDDGSPRVRHISELAEVKTISDI
jgi:hypothetical protein